MNISLTTDAKADLKALGDPSLQRIALQWMSRLRRNPKLVRELAWREGQDLRSCRKLYFDEDDTPLETNFMPAKRADDRPRYRIVYRLVPDEESPTDAQILGVGLKRDSEGGVYPRFAQRLEDGVDEPKPGP